ncbi:MAG: hypothetical protein LBI69_03895, partial [Puniceicoccales bacterium]|nr:hypothetical protein [Puniceicoccales bacterium]
MSDLSITRNMSPTINSTSGGDEAVENFKTLYANNKEGAIETFSSMLEDYTETARNKTVKFFLTLYKSESDKDKAMAILSSSKLSSHTLVEIFKNNLTDEDTATEIFKALYEKNPQKAIDTFGGMFILAGPDNVDKPIAIFSKLCGSGDHQDKTLAISTVSKLLNFEMEILLANRLLSEDIAVETFKILYEENSEKAIGIPCHMLAADESVDRASAIFSSLYGSDKDQDKIIAILSSKEL